MGCTSQTRVVENKVVFLGLDNAGKTTLVQKLQYDKEEYVQPTLGVNIEKMRLGNAEVNVFDLGGEQCTRSTWSSYLAMTELIVFVVDATDYLRFAEASSELQKLRDDPLLKDVPVILVANKTDIPSSYSLTDVEQYVNGSFKASIDVGAMAHVSDLRTLIENLLGPQQANARQ